MKLHEIKTPALIIDYNTLKQNLLNMQVKAEKNFLRLRPHIKTHKCIQIAEMQERYGANGITVSTIQEALHFANYGFSDITWAFPIQPDYVDIAFKLMKKINFSILIDSFEMLKLIKNKCLETRLKASVWLEVDTGQHRTGVDPKTKYAKELAHQLINSKEIKFAGILTHAGHSYHASTKEEIKNIATEERNLMIEFKNSISQETQIEISIGSTPTVSLSDRIEGIDEIRPGNYVFYDYTQVLLGCCDVENCALSVLATIVSINRDKNYIVTDAGALALSKDPGPQQFKDYQSFGVVFSTLESKQIIQNLKISKLTQEHGIITGEENFINEFKFNYGDKIKILMNHACLTVPLFDYYYVVQNDEVIDKWEIFRGRNLP